MKSECINVCFPFVGDTLGGSHFSGLLLLLNLDRTRFNPVIVVHELGPLTSYLVRHGIRYIHLPLPGYVGRHRYAVNQASNFLRVILPLTRFIKQHDISFVHTNDARMHYTWTASAKLMGAVSVWHQRTLYYPSKIGCQLMRLCRVLICISNFVKESLPERERSRASVIVNPVNPFPDIFERKTFREVLCRNATEDTQAAIVGTVGNLRGVKRPMDFVKVAVRIKERFHRATVFAVFGEDREDFIPLMRQYAEQHGILSRLVFMGFCDPIEPWIAACDVLISPSDGDAFGRTLVEAMLAEVPVVATDVCGHREIIQNGKTGVLVPVHDVEAMAEAALQLLCDQGLANRIKHQARLMALDRYNVGDHVRKVTDLYEKALVG